MPVVVYHYSALPLEVTTTQKCHRPMRCLLKKAIRYLKYAILVRCLLKNAIRHCDFHVKTVDHVT